MHSLRDLVQLAGHHVDQGGPFACSQCTRLVGGELGKGDKAPNDAVGINDERALAERVRPDKIVVQALTLEARQRRNIIMKFREPGDG